jgi:hypothetical protein
MSWAVLRLQDVAPMPWRNGGGVTRELLAWPDAAQWSVRLSVADVASDGPFSRFDGVQRWFAVLSGAGVRLDVAGASHALTADDAPLQFDGALPVGCTLLGGPTVDFNLMTRGHAARMARVRGAHACTVRAGQLLAAWNNGAQAAMIGQGGDALELAPMSLAWRIAAVAGQARFACGDGLWMEVAP